MRMKRNLVIGVVGILLATSALAATATQFKDMLTSAMVKNISTQFFTWLAKDQSENLNYANSMSLSQYPRSRVYQTVPELSSGWWKAENAAVLDAFVEGTRSYLANATRLRQLYNTHKASVLAALREVDSSGPSGMSSGMAALRQAIRPPTTLEGRLKAAINRFFPAMRGQASFVSNPMVKGLVDSYAAFDTCRDAKGWDACEDLYYKWSDIESNLMGPDAPWQEVHAYLFIERRRAEGGDALAKAWIDILQDFANSLKADATTGTPANSPLVRP